MRFVYESPTTPKQWIDYDMATGARSLRKTQEVPSGHDPAAYVTRRLYARAADGAEIPITVLMRASTLLDGSAPIASLRLWGLRTIHGPALLHSPTFAGGRGWIWATAHVRGGSEKGYGWFLDGRGAKKPNTFTDFIASAEHLVDHGYGAKGRIVAYGGSAGGMLMGRSPTCAPICGLESSARCPLSMS